MSSRRASSAIPIIAFIGVRISWLILARNSLLAFEAAFRSSIVLCKGLRSPKINILNITKIIAIITITAMNNPVILVL